MSEPAPEHDAITALPGAPIPAEDTSAVTVVADWHNAPGTGAYEIPPVETVTAYEKGDDGQMVAKVLAPPTRPRPTRGRRAESKAKDTPPTEAGDGDQAPAEETEDDEGEPV